MPGVHCKESLGKLGVRFVPWPGWGGINLGQDRGGDPLGRILLMGCRPSPTDVSLNPATRCDEGEKAVLD